MAAYSPIMPSTDHLQRKLVSPDEFRQMAALAGWKHAAAEAFVRKPYHKQFVAVGEKAARVLAKVVDPGGE